jgi:hypothetical protein
LVGVTLSIVVDVANALLLHAAPLSRECARHVIGNILIWDYPKMGLSRVSVPSPGSQIEVHALKRLSEVPPTIDRGKKVLRGNPGAARPEATATSVVYLEGGERRAKAGHHRVLGNRPGPRAKAIGIDRQAGASKYLGRRINGGSANR